MAKIAGRMTPGHSDMVHDMKFNFYGDLIATCSSDKLVKIFSVDRDSATGATTFFHVQDLHGHAGPVWAVCWAFPIFGNIVASCGYDKKIIVWKEIAKNSDNDIHSATNSRNSSSNRSWVPIFEHAANSGVNCIAFAPYDFLKLTLAAGCVDGSFLIFEYKGASHAYAGEAGGNTAHYDSSYGSASGADFSENTGLDADWTVREITQAHQLSINCLNWADPYFMTDQAYITQQQSQNGEPNNSNGSDPADKMRPAEPALGLQTYGVRRLITGGSDNWIKLWREDLQRDTFVQEMRFQGHQGAVRDVAWRPSRLRAGGCFASASEDRYVFVWYHNGTDPVTQWGCFWLPQFDDTAWSVSFHPGGRILGVFHGKSSVSLFVAQDPDGSRWSPANEVYTNIPRPSSPSSITHAVGQEGAISANQLLPTGHFPPAHRQRAADLNTSLNEPLRTVNKHRTAKPHGRSSMPAGTSRDTATMQTAAGRSANAVNQTDLHTAAKLAGGKKTTHKSAAGGGGDDADERDAVPPAPTGRQTGNPVIRPRAAGSSSNRPK